MARLILAFCIVKVSSNWIPIFLIVLAVITHYLDLSLGVARENSISLGLLTAGTTMLNLNVGTRKDG